MSVNRYLLTAAIVTGLATFVHAVGGEITTIASLTSSTIPSALQVELRAMWHGGTLILLGSTLILWRAAKRPDKSEVVSYLAWFYGLWGVTWMIVALIMGAQNLMDAPQWVLLLGIAGLIFAGQRKLR
jgi:hypothetical protein